MSCASMGRLLFCFCLLYGDERVRIRRIMTEGAGFSIHTWRYFTKMYKQQLLLRK
jgi:hypothetical protein